MIDREQVNIFLYWLPMTYLGGKWLGSYKPTKIFLKLEKNTENSKNIFCGITFYIKNNLFF